VTAIDLSRFRERFPIFSERVYLASQCIGPYPREGFADLEDYARSRALHNRTLEAWLDRIDELTRLCEELLGAPHGSMALLGSATACMGAIAATLEPAGARRRILVSALDFHSALHLFQAQTLRGFEVFEVPSEDGFTVSEEAIVSHIDERTALVALALVSRNSGMIDPVPIVRRAHEVGSPVLLDAYQAVGVVPVNVTALGADVVIGGFHKWLSGSTGLAFMYVDEAFSELHTPRYPGWLAHASFDRFVQAKAFEDVFVPRAGARRFQQGTPAMAAIYGSRAGLRFVRDAGVDVLRSRNAALCDHLYDRALSAGLRVTTPRPTERRAGGICIRVNDAQSIVGKLAEQGIDVDQRRLTDLRVAPHACTTVEECDHFMEALASLLAERTR
jgi:kynureninase